MLSQVSSKLKVRDLSYIKDGCKIIVDKFATVSYNQLKQNKAKHKLQHADFTCIPSLLVQKGQNEATAVTQFNNVSAPTMFFLNMLIQKKSSAEHFLSIKKKGAGGVLVVLLNSCR